MTRYYFDYNATTPLAPEALAAMLPHLRGTHGNPSSIHREGIEARYALERARRNIERLLDAERDSLVFTATGSEANALGLRGSVEAAILMGERPHLAVSAAEHKAVLDTARELAALHGLPLTVLRPDTHGRITPEQLATQLPAEVTHIALMLANNELGTLSPIAECAAWLRVNRPECHLHVDAVQAVGKVPVSIRRLDADTVAIAAHKFHGPRGAAGLFVRPGFALRRLFAGGPQERHLRAGTENVAAAVGMAEALRLSLEVLAAEGERLTRLRESLWESLAGTPGAERNSPKEDCLPGTLNVSFCGLDSRALVRRLDEAGFAVSAGSACTSDGESVSHVLEAIGAPPSIAKGSVRFSLGRETYDTSVKALTEAVTTLVIKELSLVP